MALKKFTSFVNEKQTDKELKSSVEKELSDKAENCPRCGNPFTGCICPATDYYSTVNAYRTPHGKIKQ